MSFSKSFFGRKSLSSILVLSIIVSALYFILPTAQARAQWVVSDPDTEFNTSVISVINGGIAASSVTTAAHQVAGGGIKNFLLDTLATTLARLIIQGITAQTVNWINSGFQGNPGFISNPQSFFTNIADYTVSAELNTLSGGLFNKLCSPFNLQVRLALINNYLYQNRIGQCTLGQLANNYSNWTNNFLNGGWNSWFTVTQNMQNNPYGSFLASQDELSIKVANQMALKSKQQQTNGGILNFQICKTVTNQIGGGSIVDGTSNSASAQNLAPTTASSAAYNSCMDGSDGEGHPGDDNYCQENHPLLVPVDTSDSEAPSYTQNVSLNDLNNLPVNSTGINPATQISPASYTSQQCNTQTPGSLVNAQLEKVFGSGIDQLGVTQSINQIANALITEAAKSIIGGVSGGLRSLTQPSAGNSRSLVEQLATSSAESINNQAQVLGQTLAQTPVDDQYAAGATTTAPTTPPAVDPTQVAQTVFTQSQQLQQQYCSTPGVTCATNGTGAPFGGTGGTTGGTTTPVPSFSDLYSTYACNVPTQVGDSNYAVCRALISVQSGADASTLYASDQCGTPVQTDATACAALNDLINP